MAGLHHISGCYFIVERERHYLPQVALESKTTITPISFSTELKQTFSNPTTEHVPQLRYTFPLYDGVAVCGYTIAYAGKVLRGIVKQKDVARQTYQAALDRGETAGVLEALPAGIFGVTLGNISPGQDVIVTISYCGELKHDSQVDGLRFNLPTSIAPRYGSYPGKVLQSNVGSKGGIRITVDIDMLDSAIRRVQSPSHLLSVTMGGHSNVDTGAAVPLSSSQASVTLALGSVELEDDFVLQVLGDNIGNPRAIIEAHATLPNQRAVMATLVPKFNLEQAHPEIVFIADQSGSMEGPKNLALVASLKVFLKSLPLGVRFNVCAFGSRFQFLWPKSLPYSEENVNTALEFVDTFAAAFGGTELLEPIRQAFERHLDGMPLEVMLLTDGEVWGETRVFDYINEQIRDNDVAARVFTLGIGKDVSHTLVEGVARAGNGFAQFQTENEEIDQKVMRMLKGALFAHTTDYRLEVHYEGSEETTDEDDFEIVVRDCLNITEKPPASVTTAKSFFDPLVDLDKPVQVDRYAHLPDLQLPLVIQAPDTISPLFPFNRTTIYLLLGPGSPQKNITSITLRATSSAVPLELNIPVHMTEPGTSIHQLAARRVIQDLEEGRGWLHGATISDPLQHDKSVEVRKKHESRFDEIVEREAVRVGETFGVAGKFTSFVAVDNHNHKYSTSNLSQATPVPVSFSKNPTRRRIGGDRTVMSSEQSVTKAARASAPSPSNRLALGTSCRMAISGPSDPSSFHPASDTLHSIISLQTFSGAWTWNTELLRLIGKDESLEFSKLGDDKDIAATVLVVAYMETVRSAKRDVWEMIVGKAREWLGRQMSGVHEKVEELIRMAAKEY